MMNLVAYQRSAAKPRNGGFDADEARSRWEAECTKPNAIKDNLGPTPKLARRVAIKIKDTMIFRDGIERSRSVLRNCWGGSFYSAAQLSKVWRRLESESTASASGNLALPRHACTDVAVEYF